MDHVGSLKKDAKVCKKNILFKCNRYLDLSVIYFGTYDIILYFICPLTDLIFTKLFIYAIA